MGRLIARGGVVSLVLVIAIALAVPMTSAVGQRSVKIAPAKLVNATSWAFISTAQASKKDAFAVGYSRLPSTAPTGLHWDGSAWAVPPMPHPSGGAILYSVTAVPGSKDYLAGGESCTSVSGPEAYILGWNGSAWSHM